MKWSLFGKDDHDRFEKKVDGPGDILEGTWCVDQPGLFEESLSLNLFIRIFKEMYIKNCRVAGDRRLPVGKRFRNRPCKRFTTKAKRFGKQPDSRTPSRNAGRLARQGLERIKPHSQNRKTEL